MNDAVCRIERGPYGAQFTLAVPDNSQEIPYQLETLITSRPKALLPAYRQISATGARYAYPVTGLSSLAELAVRKRLSRKQASAIARQIRQLILDLPDHLLSPQQVMLHPELLFIRQPELDVQVVYQPFLPLLNPFGEEELINWLSKSANRIPFMRHQWEKRLIPRPPEGVKAPESVLPFSHKADGQTALSFGLAIVQLFALILTLLTVVWQPPGWPLAIEEVSRPLLTFLVLSIPAQGILLTHSKARKIDVTDEQDQLLGCPNETESGSIFTSVGACIKTLATSLNPQQLMKKIQSTVLNRAEKSEANLGRVREMPTELLSSKQALFRLATLSEGMIGTAEETAGQRAFILTEEFVVGRDYRLVDLCLTGYAVGRRHARISRKGATFFITDLGSKNGTRLNGELLNKLVDYRLPDRCQIQFADRLFYFEAEELLESLSEPVAC